MAELSPRVGVLTPFGVLSPSAIAQSIIGYLKDPERVERSARLRERLQSPEEKKRMEREALLWMGMGPGSIRTLGNMFGGPRPNPGTPLQPRSAPPRTGTPILPRSTPAPTGTAVATRPPAPPPNRMPLTPSVDQVAVAAARGGGGMLFPEEKTAENLRLHQQRIASERPYPGAPKNPRTVIPAPSGSGLPDFVAGDITPEDWVQRTEGLLDRQGIADASSWYREIYEEIDRYTGGDREETKRIAQAWLAAQQNDTPAASLANVLYMDEQLRRGVPPEQVKGKGLPQANRAALAALRGGVIEGGVGQKIADFIDSGEGRDVRSIMGSDPAGGAPFVIDVHSGRDTGLVDPGLVGHLSRLDYPVPEGLLTDWRGGGIKGAMYENRALWGRGELTPYLNEIKWQGREDWSPEEAQAVGWKALENLYGTPGTGGNTATAFARSQRRISMEVDPGEGSPWATQFGARYSALDDGARQSINDAVTRRAIEMVNEHEGINLNTIVHRTGVWEFNQNPATVQQGYMSREAANRAASRFGLYLNQQEVWVNSAKELTQNPRNFSIDLFEVGTRNLRDGEQLTSLWEAIVAADPSGLVRGYQPVEDVEGNAGVRIIVPHAAMKEWASESGSNLGAAREVVKSFFEQGLGDMIGDLGYDLDRILSEAELDIHANDWKEHPNGQIHLDRIRYETGTATEAEIRAGIDSDRAELTQLYETLLSEAEAGAQASGPAEAGQLNAPGLLKKPPGQ